MFFCNMSVYTSAPGPSLDWALQQHFMFTHHLQDDSPELNKELLHLICCCSPLVVPVIRGEVGHGYCRLLFIVSFFSLFSHYVLYHQSPTPSIFCCCSPLSSHSFQIYFNIVLPLHPRCSSPPFLTTFWASALFANFSSPILFIRPTNFSILLTNVFLKLSFTPTSCYT